MLKYIKNKSILSKKGTVTIMKEALKKFTDKCKSLWGKVKDWAKTVNWKEVYDKFSTGLLIFLMASPFLVLLYIILWFVIPK